MKVPFPIALVAVVAVSGALGWAFLGGGPFSGGSTAKRVHHLPHGWSYLARARGRTLSSYRTPRGRRTMVLTDSVSAGAPLTLLVQARRKRWVQVYLPIRPNGGKGWVKARSVRILTTALKLAVHLRSHRLLLSSGRRVIRRFPIGVGRSVTPTPTGTYFITELLKQPDPAGPYGPFAFGLSAYSGVLSHFGRGGNGQIGIHGTDEPALVGTDVSHGCIRLRNRDIVWLTKRLPLGTPVIINRA